MSKPFAVPDTESIEQDQLVPLYRVVLLDDNDHTYDYVIEMLQRSSSYARPGLSPRRRSGSLGRTVLITCELAQAEFGRDQIHAYGRDWRLDRSKGSMSAVVEPAG